MSCYNDDELDAPAWINQEFLENVLSNYENNGKVEITKYDMSPASMKGDHYASIMFRCQVEYRFAAADNASKSMKRSLIIKTLPSEDGMKREMLMESKVFETEIGMYTETLPKIEKILAQFGEPTKLSAGIFYHSLEPHKVIILEDLCELGYNTVRDRYLSEDEIKAVLQKLAKIHAVSYMLGHSETPELVTKYQDGFLGMSMPMVKDMMDNGFRNFIDLLSSYDDLAIYLEKIKDIQEEMEQTLKNLSHAYTLNNGQGDIFVLNHGDFHMKNLMFKFNGENQMEDIIMVDYQGCCYAPSTIDLIYSQFMMLGPELRMRRHEFMYYYFSEFSRILKKINCPGILPKYSEFQMAALKYRHYSLYMLGILYPLVVGFLGKSQEELKDADTKELIENPEVVALNYKLPSLIEEIRQFLPVLLREGYLD